MPQAVIQSATFVNENMAMGDFAEGKMSFHEYRKQLTTADILFIKDATDVAPYNEFEKQMKSKLYNFKRIAKRVLYVTGLRNS